MFSCDQGGGGTWILNQGWEGGGPAKGRKKKVTPTILMSDNDNEDREDLTRPILPSISASQPYATLEGDLEDAISGKSPRGPTLTGQKDCPMTFFYTV